MGCDLLSLMVSSAFFTKDNILLQSLNFWGHFFSYHMIQGSESLPPLATECVFELITAA